MDERERAIVPSETDYNQPARAGGAAVETTSSGLKATIRERLALHALDYAFRLLDHLFHALRP